MKPVLHFYYIGARQFCREEKYQQLPVSPLKLLGPCKAFQLTLLLVTYVVMMDILLFEIYLLGIFVQNEDDHNYYLSLDRGQNDCLGLVVLTLPKHAMLYVHIFPHRVSGKEILLNYKDE